MNPSPADVLLVIDDNPADIQLLALAWSEEGYEAEIPLHACHSCATALLWLEQARAVGQSPRGILADLMLFDHEGTVIIDVLQRLPGLSGVPLLSWSGIEVGRSITDRIATSGVRRWTKPGSWSGYADFVRRLMNVLSGRSSASHARLPIA